MAALLTVAALNSSGLCTVKFIALSGYKINRICFQLCTTSDNMDFCKIEKLHKSTNTLPSCCGQHDIDHHSSITHHQTLRPCFRKEIRKPHIITILFPYLCDLVQVPHCNVIIGRNPIEANATTGAIQLLGNPVAYIRNCFTLH